jgi:hypothetical protein
MRTIPIAFAFAACVLLATFLAAAERDSKIASSRDLAAPAMIHKAVRVAASNDDWTRSGVRVHPGDIVVIFAAGAARTRETGKEIGPDGGPTGAGRLEAKVGTGEAILVGKSFVFKSADDGILKLRARDSHYEDNVGGYEVSVLYIPAAIVPKATVATEQGD